MKRNKTILSLVLLCLSFQLFALTPPLWNTKVQSLPSDSAFKRNPYRPVALLALTNGSIWSFNRYIAKEHWAVVNIHTMSKNMIHGFTWDSDGLETNMFSHPYHGSLYYNAARSNGMNYWESIPYTLLGSFSWELLAENEPASVNDLFATSFGGLALGEISHRLSYKILDESTTGFPRVGRELAAGLINPMGFINRLIDGDVWKRKKRGYHRPYSNDDAQVTLGIGNTFISESSAPYKGGGAGVLDLNIKYNNPFEIANPVPYEYFTMDASFNVIGTQPFVGKMNILGLLYGKQYTPIEGHRMVTGVFQHLSYYDSKSGIKGSEVIPFKLASAASFGLGILYNLKNNNQSIDLKFGLIMNGILMGGSASDYDKIGERDYNFGSGFSTLTNTEITFRKKASFRLGAEIYQLYTWKGWNPEADYSRLPPELLNVQGDRSYTTFLMLNPQFNIFINPNLSFRLNGYMYSRRTNYKYEKDVLFITYETKASIHYTF
ncbi:MAG: DUF3943 domain-containing protein [Bacteroidales bacterium]